MEDRRGQRTGKLYLVATPIGNLKDITLRALEVLKSVSTIGCEDTRRSKILLEHYGIRKDLVSFFQPREVRRTDVLIERLLRGESVALITDSGTPNISDPGYRLVRSSRDRGIPVIPIPGACALVTALSISGLPTDSFIFEGFLPAKQGPRREKIRAWKSEHRTVIFYESPHRLERTLKDLKEELGDLRVVLARELTKHFEEVRTLPITAWLEEFKIKKPQGEFVVLFHKGIL